MKERHSFSPRPPSAPVKGGRGEKECPEAEPRNNDVWRAEFSRTVAKDGTFLVLNMGYTLAEFFRTLILQYFGHFLSERD